ncbi:MAG: hypothetical protein EOP82_05405 [Variovorax sp.]|nr:MAG: hypothetical protein EOP82_05405 [Variovorax sp.]
MPVFLLHRIAREGLPLEVKGEGEIRALRILLMAEHVEAEIRPSVLTPSGVIGGSVVVTGITPRFRLALQRFPPQKP